MTHSNGGQTRILDVYRNLGRKVSRGVGAYLDAPNEARTHNLRVAIRKFQVLAKQLPKKERGRDMQRYLQKCKKFLRLTTDVRDFDIIRERLARQRGNNAVQAMLRDLDRERRKLVKRSVRMARKIRDSKSPMRPVWSGVWPRVRRSLGESDNKVPEMLALVVKSEGNVKALHQLKKEVRQYRYLLELLPQSPGVTKACDSLRQLQDRLGEIRDSDVVLDYLEGAGQAQDVRALLDAERNFRDARYRDLVNGYSRGLGGASQSVLAMARLSRLRVPSAGEAT